MKNNKILYVSFATALLLVSCKKDTLVEVVDVPDTPIVKIEQKGGKPSDIKAIEGAFSLYVLPFDYNALEPDFDAATMELHYSKHYLGYVNSLNKSIVGTKYEILELDPILRNLNLSDAAIRDNAGGVYNHNFFFEALAPKSGGEPSGSLLESINKDFGSFDEFSRQFVETSNRLTGSGWTWLVSDKTGKLKIVTSANNDNPLMKNLGISGIPILNLDMWEHAYYLKFQNRKREYANTFFSVINWEVAEKRYEAFSKSARVTVSAQPAQSVEVTTEPVKQIIQEKPKQQENSVDEFQ